MTVRKRERERDTRGKTVEIERVKKKVLRDE